MLDNASIQTESSDDEEEHKNEIKKIRVTRQVETEAFVMNGSLDGAPLLSEATLLDLGCIKYDFGGKFQPQNRYTINHINTDDEDVLKLVVLSEPTNQEEKERFQEIRNLIKDKSEIFKGVGCFKKSQVHLELKEDARPIIQKPRQIPIHY